MIGFRLAACVLTAATLMAQAPQARIKIDT